MKAQRSVGIPFVVLQIVATKVIHDRAGRDIDDPGHACAACAVGSSVVLTTKHIHDVVQLINAYRVFYNLMHRPRISDSRNIPRHVMNSFRSCSH